MKQFDLEQPVVADMGGTSIDQSKASTRSNREWGRDGYKGDRMMILEKAFQVFLASSDVAEMGQVSGRMDAQGPLLREFLDQPEIQAALYEYLEKHPNDDDIEALKDMEGLLLMYRDFSRPTLH